MKNPKNQVRLENIYMSDTAQASLYVIGDYALRIFFYKSSSLNYDYNEITLDSFVFFKYRKEEVEELKKSKIPSIPTKDIYIDEEEWQRYTKALEDEELYQDKDYKLISWDLNMFLRFFAEESKNIQITLHKDFYDYHSFFEKGLIDYFETFYKDKYYKNGIYPNITRFIKKG